MSETDFSECTGINMLWPSHPYVSTQPNFTFATYLFAYLRPVHVYSTLLELHTLIFLSIYGPDWPTDGRLGTTLSRASFGLLH